MNKTSKNSWVRKWFIEKGIGFLVYFDSADSAM